MLGGAPIAIVGTPRPDRLTDAFDSGTMIASVPGARRARERADLVIRPRGRGVGLLELHLIDMMVEAGREAAMEALEQAPAELWS